MKYAKLSQYFLLSLCMLGYISTAKLHASTSRLDVNLTDLNGSIKQQVTSTDKFLNVQLAAYFCEEAGYTGGKYQFHLSIKNPLGTEVKTFSGEKTSLPSGPCRIITQKIQNLDIGIFNQKGKYTISARFEEYYNEITTPLTKFNTAEVEYKDDGGISSVLGQRIRLISPPNQFTIYDPQPMFHWSIAPQAVKYAVFVGENKDPMSGPTWFSEMLTSNMVRYPLNARALKKGVAYYWQVQAFDNMNRPVGNNQGKSEVYEFRYGTGGGSEIVLVSPQKDDVVKTLRLEFRWENLTGSHDYEVQLFETENVSGEPLWVGSTTEGSVVYPLSEPDLIRGKKYYWRVRLVKPDYRQEKFSELVPFVFEGGIPATVHTEKLKEGESGLRGKVTDQFGNPVAGAVLVSEGPAEEPEFMTKEVRATDTGGNFSLKLPAGKYNISLSKENHRNIVDTISVEKGKIRVADKILFSAQTILRGNITDNIKGTKVGLASVVLKKDLYENRLTAEEDGSFIFKSLKEGSYLLEITAKPSYKILSFPVTVKAGENIADIKLIPYTSGAVGLRMYEKKNIENQSVMAGIGWADIEMSPLALDNDFSGTGNALVFKPQMVNAGYLKAENLQPGEWKAVINTERYPPFTAAFKIEPGKTQDVEVIFNANLPIITGNVYDSTSRPIAGARIQARNLPGLPYCQTDTAGSFSCQVPSGDIDLIFTHNYYSSVSKKINVPVTGISVGDIRLSRANSQVKLKVLDTRDLPVPKAKLMIKPQIAGDFEVKNLETDEFGQIPEFSIPVYSGFEVISSELPPGYAKVSGSFVPDEQNFSAVLKAQKLRYLTGKTFGSSGVALSGTNIALPGGNFSAISDNAGNFVIPVPDLENPPAVAEVIFKRTGYFTEIKRIDWAQLHIPLDVRMRDEREKITSFTTVRINNSIREIRIELEEIARLVRATLEKVKRDLDSTKQMIEQYAAVIDDRLQTIEKLKTEFQKEAAKPYITPLGLKLSSDIRYKNNETKILADEMQLKSEMMLQEIASFIYLYKKYFNARIPELDALLTDLVESVAQSPFLEEPERVRLAAIASELRLRFNTETKTYYAEKSVEIDNYFAEVSALLKARVSDIVLRVENNHREIEKFIAELERQIAEAAEIRRRQEEELRNRPFVITNSVPENGSDLKGRQPILIFFSKSMGDDFYATISSGQRVSYTWLKTIDKNDTLRIEPETIWQGEQITLGIDGKDKYQNSLQNGALVFGNLSRGDAQDISAGLKVFPDYGSVLGLSEEITITGVRPFKPESVQVLGLPEGSYKLEIDRSKRDNDRVRISPTGKWPKGAELNLKLRALNADKADVGTELWYKVKDEKTSGGCPPEANDCLPLGDPGYPALIDKMLKVKDLAAKIKLRMSEGINEFRRVPVVLAEFERVANLANNNLKFLDSLVQNLSDSADSHIEKVNLMKMFYKLAAGPSALKYETSAESEIHSSAKVGASTTFTRQNSISGTLVERLQRIDKIGHFPTELIMRAHPSKKTTLNVMGMVLAMYRFESNAAGQPVWPIPVPLEIFEYDVSGMLTPDEIAMLEARNGPRYFLQEAIKELLTSQNKNNVRALFPRKLAELKNQEHFLPEELRNFKNLENKIPPWMLKFDPDSILPENIRAFNLDRLDEAEKTALLEADTYKFLYDRLDAKARFYLPAKESEFNALKNDFILKKEIEPKISALYTKLNTQDEKPDYKVLSELIKPYLPAELVTTDENLKLLLTSEFAPAAPATGVTTNVGLTKKEGSATTPAATSTGTSAATQYLKTFLPATLAGALPADFANIKQVEISGEFVGNWQEESAWNTILGKFTDTIFNPERSVGFASYAKGQSSYPPHLKPEPAPGSSTEPSQQSTAPAEEGNAFPITLANIKLGYAKSRKESYLKFDITLHLAEMLGMKGKTIDATSKNIELYALGQSNLEEISVIANPPLGADISGFKFGFKKIYYNFKKADKFGFEGTMDFFRKPNVNVMMEFKKFGGRFEPYKLALTSDSLKWGSFALNSFTWDGKTDVITFGGSYTFNSLGKRFTLSRFVIQKGIISEIEIKDLNIAFVQAAALSVQTANVRVKLNPAKMEKGETDWEKITDAVQFTATNSAFNVGGKQGGAIGTFIHDPIDASLPYSVRAGEVMIEDNIAQGRLNYAIKEASLAFPQFLDWGVFGMRGDTFIVSYDNRTNGWKLKFGGAVWSRNPLFTVEGRAIYNFEKEKDPVMESISILVNAGPVKVAGLLVMKPEFFYMEAESVLWNLGVRVEYFNTPKTRGRPSNWYISAALKGAKLLFLPIVPGIIDGYITGGGFKIGERNGDMIIGMNTVFGACPAGALLCYAELDATISFVSGENLMSITGRGSLLPELAQMLGMADTAYVSMEMRLNENPYLSAFMLIGGELGPLTIQAQMEFYIDKNAMSSAAGGGGVLMQKIGPFDAKFIGTAGVQQAVSYGKNAAVSPLISYNGMNFAKPRTLGIGYIVSGSLFVTVGIEKAVPSPINKLLTGYVASGTGTIWVIDFKPPSTGGGFYNFMRADVSMFCIGVSLYLVVDVGAKVGMKGKRMTAYAKGTVMAEACVSLAVIEECLSWEASVEFGEVPTDLPKMPPGSDGWDPSPKATPSIKVVDTFGVPLSGALVRFSGPASASCKTTSTGYCGPFDADIPIGQNYGVQITPGPKDFFELAFIESGTGKVEGNNSLMFNYPGQRFVAVMGPSPMQKNLLITMAIDDNIVSDYSDCNPENFVIVNYNAKTRAEYGTGPSPRGMGVKPFSDPFTYDPEIPASEYKDKSIYWTFIPNIPDTGPEKYFLKVIISDKCKPLKSFESAEFAMKTAGPSVSALEPSGKRFLDTRTKHKILEMQLGKISLGGKVVSTSGKGISDVLLVAKPASNSKIPGEPPDSVLTISCSATTSLLNSTVGNIGLNTASIQYVKSVVSGLDAGVSSDQIEKVIQDAPCTKNLEETIKGIEDGSFILKDIDPRYNYEVTGVHMLRNYKETTATFKKKSFARAQTLTMSESPTSFKMKLSNGFSDYVFKNIQFTLRDLAGGQSPRTLSVSGTEYDLEKEGVVTDPVKITKGRKVEMIPLQSFNRITALKTDMSYVSFNRETGAVTFDFEEDQVYTLSDAELTVRTGSMIYGKITNTENEPIQPDATHLKIKVDNLTKSAGKDYRVVLNAEEMQNAADRNFEIHFKEPIQGNVSLEISDPRFLRAPPIMNTMNRVELDMLYSNHESGNIVLKSSGNLAAHLKKITTDSGLVINVADPMQTNQLSELSISSAEVPERYRSLPAGSDCRFYRVNEGKITLNGSPGRNKASGELAVSGIAVRACFDANNNPTTEVMTEAMQMPEKSSPLAESTAMTLNVEGIKTSAMRPCDLNLKTGKIKVCAFKADLSGQLGKVRPDPGYLIEAKSDSPLLEIEPDGEISIVAEDKEIALVPTNSKLSIKQGPLQIKPVNAIKLVKSSVITGGDAVLTIPDYSLEIPAGKPGANLVVTPKANALDIDMSGDLPSLDLETLESIDIKSSNTITVKGAKIQIEKISLDADDKIVVKKSCLNFGSEYNSCSKDKSIALSEFSIAESGPVESTISTDKSDTGEVEIELPFEGNKKKFVFDKSKFSVVKGKYSNTGELLFTAPAAID